MDKLGPQHAAAIWESLCGQQDELGALLATALGGECTVDDIKDVGEGGEWREQLKETQLAIGLLTSATGIVLAIPKSLVPGDEGVAAEKKWRDVGEKLQADYLSEIFASSSVQVTTPEDPDYLASSLTPDAGCLELAINFGEAAHKAYLVWPLAHLILLFTEPAPEDVLTAADFAGEDEAPVEEPEPAPQLQPAAQQGSPDFSRSLMQIKLPVMVTLARQKLKVGRILEIAPGSLIQFDKFCEDMLDVEAAEHKIALGEAVKVGDKFGIRITSMVLPPERFVTVEQEQKKAG